VSEPKRYQPVVQCVEPSYQAQMIEPKVMEFSEGEYVLHSDYARLKAEVERLNTGIQPEGSNDAVGRAVNVLLEKEKEIARLKAEVDRLAMSEGYHYTAIAVSTLKEQLHQKHIDYLEARKANEAKVEMIARLKAEVERLTNLKSGADYFKAKEGKQS
jgi:uncharacterized small protein (DUF1192 family)